MTTPPPASGFRLGSLSPVIQWGVLAAGSLPLAALFSLIELPAALLLGAMTAGIIVACGGGSIRAPRRPALAAQAVIGCLVARAVTADSVMTFLGAWPLFLSVVLGILATSVALGWRLTRLGTLPGTTGVWGIAPGGASVMMLMAGEFGADARLVAFMQYLRVVLVAAVASLVARIWVGPPEAAPEAAWLGALDWRGLAATLAIAGLGGAAGTLLRIPAGAMLVPMAAGAVLEGTGLVHIVLPPWLLAATYFVLGWNIGLGFTRESLLRAGRALPQVLAATVTLIAVSAALAAALVWAAGVDPMTAYLATSPGGMDTVAIIATAAKADLSFVMALQTLRLVIVLAAGPPLARLIARRMRR